MEFCTLASGSSGNAALLRCGKTTILLDAGISARRITTAMKALGMAPDDLTGIFITHEHSDHISGLATLAKQLQVPVYATAPTLHILCQKIPMLQGRCREIYPGRGVELEEIFVHSFPTSHDAACSVGYRVTGNDGCIVTLATDLGYLSQGVKRAAQGCDLLVCETNHDEDWVRTGPYPYHLKQRVLGDYGHLSNEVGAELATMAVESGARTVLLAHLSSENNTPARARQVAELRLSYSGIDAQRDITLAVAPKKEMGAVYQLHHRGEVCQFPTREQVAVC